MNSILHLLTVSAMFVALSASAQQQPAKLLQADGQSLFLETPSNVFSPYDVVPVSSPSGAATGDTVWYDDFSDLSNWITGVESSSTVDSLWKHTLTGPSGTLTSGLGDIESATASNGWAIFDAEANGSLTPTGGPAPGVTFDSYIQMANPVDLSGINSVAVTFTEFYYELNTSVYLEVSTDGANWTTIQLHPDLQSNEATEKDAVQYRDISAIAGGEMTVWVRLRYSGGGVFWQVDDFMLVEGTSYDISMIDVYSADLSIQYEYSIVPLSQATELTIGAIAANEGGLSMANPVYSYQVSGPSGSLADSSFVASSDTIASGSADTTYFNSGLVPSDLGEYTITVSVAGDSVDTRPSNNERSTNFFVSDSIYSHADPENLSMLVTGLYSADFPAPEYKVGLFYEIVEDATLYAIQTVLWEQSTIQTTAESITWEVYELVPGDNTMIIDMTPIVDGLYDLQPEEISNSTSLNLINIEVNGEDGVELTAGNSYLVAIGNPVQGDTLVFLGSPGNDDEALALYGPYGQGGSVNWFGGSSLPSTTPVIDLKIGTEEVGIKENEDLSDLSLYPNPTRGDLRISYTSKENQNMTFNVFDVNGSLMLMQQEISKIGQKNTVQLDVSGLASGMYLVQIQGVNSTLTRRFVVN